MRYLVALFLLSLASAPASAAERVELYTMGLGDELFSKFGHAALCVVAPDLPGGGLCYNYGTSDFSRPIGLAWDVVRGRAKFWVSVSDLVSMLLSFQVQDRTIYRQVLPLTDEQAAGLREALEIGALPENREYIYSHFLDNCSTRPRDLIDVATGGALGRTALETTRTYRDFAREGFAAFHWALVPAGDLILGRWVDQDIDTYEAMFIPEVLAAAVREELGVEREIVYQRERPLDAANVGEALFRFWIVVVALAALAWISRLGAVFALVLASVLGALLWVGAIVSPWPELHVNELLLVLVPVDVLLLWRPGARRYVTFRLWMLAAIAVLAVAGVFIQPLWPFWFLVTATLASFGWRGRKGILAR